MVDSEQLVEIVRTRPILYQSSRDIYRDSRKKAEAWKEVAEQLNASVEACKTRWRSLRTQYVKNLKRDRDLRRQGVKPHERSSRDKMMDFILPFTSTRGSNGVMLPVKEEQSDGEQEEFDVVSDDASVSSGAASQDQDSSAGAESDSMPPTRGIKRKKRGQVSQPVVSQTDIVAAIVSYMEKVTPIPKDDDELFLMSLLPALRRVPAAKKLECRIAVMKALSDYSEFGG